MLIRIRSKSEVLSSEITPESAYFNRRTLMKAMSASALSFGLPSIAGYAFADEIYKAAEDRTDTPAWLKQKIAERTVAKNSINEPLTPYKDATHYNNFYEFGLEKSDPAEYEDKFNSHPWNVEITGEVDKPGLYQLEDFVKPYHLEDRVYRFRCVEAWSVVLPWLGFPLKDLIEKVQPNSKAKFMAFTTLMDKKQFPDQSSDSLPWPYLEGLRMDEARNPLTLMAMGLYGRSLPAQNGAPLRLIVPWKYGFKSIKSIVKISFVEQQPVTTWNTLAPHEYGFYSNVNPSVDHPRWTQKRERRLPNTLFDPNWKETLPFNGYAEEVAALYEGMDLHKYF